MKNLGPVFATATTGNNGIVHFNELVEGIGPADGADRRRAVEVDGRWVEAPVSEELT